MWRFLLFVVFSGFCLNAQALPPKADSILVYKAKREMLLLAQGKTIKRYRIALGDAPVGPKQQEGDERTPEGVYVIDYRNKNSHYHRSLHISYPNAADRNAAKKRGVNPGGMIMIHGLPNQFKGPDSTVVGYDWTDGCIAVSNTEIEEIWDLVSDGTRIEIKP